MTSGGSSRHALLRAFALGWSGAGWLWLASLVLACLSGVFIPAAAWISRTLIDTLATPHRNIDRVVLLAVAMAASGVLSALSGNLAGLLSYASQRSISITASQRLYQALNRVPGIAFFEDPTYQDSLRLAEQASQEMPGALCNMLLTFLRTAFTMAGFAGALLFIWPPAPLVFLAVLVPSILAELALARRQAVLNEAASGDYRRQASYRFSLSNPQGAKEIRAFGIGDFILGKLIEAFKNATGKQLRGQQHAFRVQVLVMCLIGVAVAASAGFGAYATAVGRISVGDFVLFSTALATAQGSAASLLSISSMLMASIARFRKYLEILHLPDQLATGSLPVPPLSRGIQFDNVWFRYSEDGEWILKGLTMWLPAGRSTGIVGLNGAGKTTIVKLLCRFYEPQQGAIRWDGLDLHECSVDSLRERLSVTFQDFVTYELNATENIGVGKLSRLADQDAIEESARLAEIHGALKSLPHGYRTMLTRLFVDPATGNGGVALSGGQNQRIALARSLLRSDADVIILDEPSSGLDPEAEYKIHQTLRTCSIGKTSLLISHRLSTLRDADRILVIADGEIAESGKHDQLMAANGGYAVLFALQAEGYLEPQAAEG
jgi:ATP-binding cassette subfamily B protein